MASRDRIAVIDINDDGATSFAQTFSPSYAADPEVTSRGTVTPGTNGYTLVTYVVGAPGPAAVFVQTDTFQVGLGSFATQSSSASSNAAAQHLTVMRIVAGSKNALKRRR